MNSQRASVQLGKEDGGRRTEDGCQKSEVRGQRTEDSESEDSVSEVQKGEEEGRLED